MHSLFSARKESAPKAWLKNQRHSSSNQRQKGSLPALIPNLPRRRDCSRGLGSVKAAAASRCLRQPLTLPRPRQEHSHYSGQSKDASETKESQLLAPNHPRVTESRPSPFWVNSGQILAPHRSVIMCIAQTIKSVTRTGKGKRRNDWQAHSGSLTLH